MVTAASQNCLFCDRPVKGRTDKKYCNGYCRNNYNNQLKSRSTNTIRNINNRLIKNRRILEEAIPEGEEMGKVHKDRLIEKGFLFKYMTHIYTNKNGQQYFFCYDLGYLPLDNDWFLVVKRK